MSTSVAARGPAAGARRLRGMAAGRRPDRFVRDGDAA
jgi:hypothetical protein